MVHKWQAFNIFFVTLIHKDCQSEVRLALLVTLLATKKLEKPQNLVIGLVVADRHNVCPRCYAQDILARKLNILSTENSKLLLLVTVVAG